MATIKIRFVLLILIFLAIGAFFLVDLIAAIPPGELIAPSVGTPVLTTRENDLLYTGISQVVSDDENLYILFGTYSVVQVYSLKGDYRYSVSVYNFLNGRTTIAAKDGCLYVCDKQFNVYIIEDGAFSRFIDRKGSADIRNTLDFDYSNPRYEVRQSSLWCVPDGSNAYCVLQRPTWLVLCQGNVSWCAEFLLLILCGVILFLPKIQQPH